MPKITDGGMNNAGVIDGLRLPQLVTMLSLMSLDYASGSPVLRPNTSLFNHLKRHSEPYDFGDGQGQQKGITMFSLDEVIKRANVGAFFPGHQITRDMLDTPAQWPIPRFEGDLLLVRTGQVTSGTPSISAKDAVYAWSPTATPAASGAPYADEAGGKTGAWVNATPKLVARGLIYSAALEKPCESTIEDGADLPNVITVSASVTSFSKGNWYKASDGKIRKALEDTYINPASTSSAGYVSAWGTPSKHYTQDAFNVLVDSVYCSFFSALKHLADVGSVARDEFGNYDVDTFVEGIVYMLGSVKSDASIESYKSASVTMPSIYLESNANDNYVQGRYYRSNVNGLIYERIGSTGGVDPTAFDTAGYASLWNAGLTDEGLAEKFGANIKLRINVQHDASFSGEGNVAKPLKVQADQIDFSGVPRCTN